MIQKLHDTGTILIIFLSSMIVLYGACGGKVVLDEGYQGGVGGMGGAGGAIINSANSAAQSGSGAGNSTGAFTSAGSGTPIPCATCSEYISNSSAPLCPESEEIFKLLYTCVCAGPCAMQCQDNYCNNPNQLVDSCAKCVFNVCKNEFNACANDL